MLSATQTWLSCKQMDVSLDIMLHTCTWTMTQQTLSKHAPGKCLCAGNSTPPAAGSSSSHRYCSGKTSHGRQHGRCRRSCSETAFSLSRHRKRRTPSTCKHLRPHSAGHLLTAPTAFQAFGRMGGCQIYASKTTNIVHRHSAIQCAPNATPHIRQSSALGCRVSHMAQITSCTARLSNSCRSLGS